MFVLYCIHSFFKKKKFIYLFIYLRRVLVAAGGLLSCSTRAPQLWHANSQLRHACGIQFPDQGSNPGPLPWERGVLSTAPPGKSLCSLLTVCFLLLLKQWEKLIILFYCLLVYPQMETVLCLFLSIYFKESFAQAQKNLNVV